MTMVRLPHAEIMTTWRPISHSDILHIQQELAKVHSSVSTGIQGTRRTVEEILEDATHSRRRLLTHLLQRCLSPPKGITILQLIPRPGLQLTATSWPRQLSTPLPSLLCLTMAPTLPTLRLTNLRMLMVSVILNFKTWTDCVLFGQYFLENTYVVFFFVRPAFSTCTYHHHIFTHGSDISNDVNIYLHTLRSLQRKLELHLETIRLTPQFRRVSVPRISGIMSKVIDGSWAIVALDQPWNVFQAIPPWTVNFP